MENQVKSSPFYTLSEAANIFRVSKATMKRWLRNGKIRGVRVNPRGDWRIPKSEIEKLL